jgi:hypothetical protein
MAHLRIPVLATQITPGAEGLASNDSNRGGAEFVENMWEAVYADSSSHPLEK